jgi:hypothetical protein
VVFDPHVFSAIIPNSAVWLDDLDQNLIILLKHLKWVIDQLHISSILNLFTQTFPMLAYSSVNALKMGWFALKTFCPNWSYLVLNWCPTSKILSWFGGLWSNWHTVSIYPFFLLDNFHCFSPLDCVGYVGQAVQKIIYKNSINQNSLHIELQIYVEV